MSIVLALAAPSLASDALPTPASPVEYCDGAPAATAPQGSETVAATAAKADAQMAAEGGADAALRLLLAQPVDWAVASAADRAHYCLAAGRAMRLATAGSQVRSQQFLGEALTLAAGAGNDPLAAQAAWQLALALAGGRPPAMTTRRRSAEGSEQPFTLADVPGCGLVRDELARADVPRALVDAAFACAVERARMAGDRQLAARAGLRLARLRAGGDNALEPALSALAGLGETRSGADELALARELILLALDLGGRNDPRLVAAAARWQTTIAADPDQTAAATAIAGRMATGERQAALLRRAVFLESQKAAPLDLPRYLLMLADAVPAEAPVQIAAAYRALERVRPLQPAVDPLTEESLFDTRTRPIFERAIGSTLTGASDDAATIDQVQHIAEAYRSAELQNVLGSECVPPRSPVSPAELMPGEVLLYPLILDDRIELIYATGDDRGGKVRRYHRMAPNYAVNRATIARLSQQMTASLSGVTDDWRMPARALYDVLIAPIQSLLKEDGTLIVVPDGPLRRVSLAALIAPDGRPLIERTRLAVVPALSFAEPGRADARPLIVAASLEKEIDLPVGRFARLDGTAAEAAIAATSHRTLLADFTRAQLAAALARQPASVLHLATHAAFNGRSERSFIVANGETIALPELRAMLSANQLRGEALDLLVLSACETAVGDDDQAMGLASAAVEAGARSALASLWEVSDRGTLALMTGFYEHYRTGAGHAAALRAAQLALLRSTDPDLADPGVWSAFTLVGSWR
jgi:CHAT domain-containing protein